jgi:hypothetical protein
LALRHDSRVVPPRFGAFAGGVDLGWGARGEHLA